MSAASRLAAYGLVLVAVVGAGAAIGAAAGPIDVGDDEPSHDAGHAGEAPTGTAAHAGDHADGGGSALPVGGLLVAQDGYRFVPADRTLEAGAPQPFAFRIDGPDGEPVRDYDVAHDKELHLVVVGRDLRGYAHVHPERAADGTWSVELPALAAGSYRAFADFVPAGGEPLTLGVDVSVTGAVAPAEPLADARTASVAGYEVTLDGDPAAGEELTVTVRRDGQVVATEPYLGAAGHLVAIRDGDLGYLHVHPLDEEPTGPVRFAVEVPSEGRYALFFDFAHEGAVHTAPFVLTVGEPVPDGAAHTHADGAGH